MLIDRTSRLSPLAIAIGMVLSQSAYAADDCREYSSVGGQMQLCIAKTDLGTLL